jgi:AraC family transcriptional regulator
MTGRNVARLTGACRCGAVRFDVEDAFAYAGYCHCRQCRAVSGSAFAAFAGIERDKLAIVHGDEHVASYRKGATQIVNFCRACGGVVFVALRGAFVHVPLGALGEAPRVAPTFHAFVGSKAPWYEIADALPQFVEHAPPCRLGLFPSSPERTDTTEQKSRGEYTRRLRDVLDYVDGHLDEPLDLETLARIAHFSPFHFHRVFAAWMGETLGEYLRNRRLERAAAQLVSEPRASVLSIAIDVGFGSGEALARAFKQRYGCTPSAWRSESPRDRGRRLYAAGAGTDGKSGQVMRNAGQTAYVGNDHYRRTTQLIMESNMKVNVVDAPPTRVAYLRHLGAYGPDVGAFWNKTVMPWIGSLGLLDKPRYGIGLDNPSVTPAAQCRYDACVEVPADFVAKAPAALVTLPGGRYAVREFAGSPETINDAWNEVFREWLPSSGMQMDMRPCIEYYRGGSPINPKTGAFECELWVPVVPLR